MSSMEDCSEYSNPHNHPQQQHHRHGQQHLQQQQQQQQQQQHHQNKLSAALSSNTLSHHQGQGQTHAQTSGSGGGNTTLTRGSRRSSYGHSHYQQQLVPQAVNFHDGLGLADNISVGSGSVISNYSGQRYVPDLQYGTLGNRIMHSERYVIDDSSCLQPPSPAPSNDHYVMGMPSPSPSAHHFPDRHYTFQQRTMSPSTNNSRYRHSLSESYRDMSPQCDRYIPPPAHFLDTTNPLSATDSYGYLNSNVHTPVKRYVPTPPPQEPTYQPQTQLMAAILTQTASQQRNSHLTSTLPYRFRVKSCPNEQTISPPKGFDTSDHYATPPRVQPIKCQSSLTTSCSVPSSALSAQTMNSGRQSRQSTEYLVTRAPSAEFLDQPSCRVATPVSVMSEPNGSASCLHCSTLRRTTGVHQTTQTSGLISPQPLSISSATESTGQQSPMSPASLSSSMTTAQSPSSVHQSSHNHHQPQATAQLPHHHLQSSQIPSNILTAAQSHPQIAPDKYSKLEPRDISTIPRNIAKQQQPSQQPSANSSEHSIITNSNSRSILIQYQQQSILQQPPAQQQIQPPPPVQSVPPQQIVPQQPPQVQPQASQPPQSQPMPVHVAPVSLPGPSMQPHSPPVSDSPASSLQRNAQQVFRSNVSNLSRKQRVKEYLKHETAKFFGVESLNEDYERHKWEDRQKRFAIRRFGQLKDEYDFAYRNSNTNNNTTEENVPPVDRPDVLPAQSQDERDTEQTRRQRANPYYTYDNGSDNFIIKAERKPSVPTVLWNGISFLVRSITRKRLRKQKQWSRSFAPAHVELTSEDSDLCDGLQPIQDEETFFDTPVPTSGQPVNQGQVVDNSRQLFVSDGDRGIGGPAGSGIINGWRTRSSELQLQIREGANGTLGQRISSHILDGVLDNSMRPIGNKVKLLRPNLLDDRYDYRPFFTYWVNTVQVLVLVISLICYGFGPIGIGMEYKTAQVLVTSLSLQQVHHQETRNVWIGLRNTDIVHLGAKYGACMRRDSRITEVISKTRKQERETACCIRNDDSGCVQSSQADCSMRGLWPTKTIATWKKWSPGESGPGGRISGSVCGLDPKYCDAPASVAPHEWPDDITKWPICRKNNQFSQRFRFKDHTAEHMVCEVIGHPCCIGVYGECRITTREYCDFVNGYFHEEASLCSQVSCLNDVCGMFPFMASNYPDQFYRLFTSLCLHAGIIHLAITVAFQHLLMSDLERLIGPLRMAILYIGSGIAGNLTSAIFVPYKAEVGPLPSLAGVLSSLMIQLMLCHWKSLKKPHVAMIKLLVIGCTLFGLGTLPWQQNFTGLIAGLLFGIGLTLSFVPFVNVTKHTRKSKINLIWTCIVLQFVIYAVMFITFYIFPLLFSSLNFIDGNQLTDHNPTYSYHDHYNLYEGYQNYNPAGGNGHIQNHGGNSGIVNGGNHIVTTYNGNSYKTPTGHGGGILHNHHEYGGGGGGGGISMSGGINKLSNNNNNRNNNLMKGISMCEKGQCVQRQPRSADTNA